MLSVGQGSPYTLHELYEWASGADALTGDRRETLQHLEGAVKRLSAEACVKLLEVNRQRTWCYVHAGALHKLLSAW